MLRLVGLSSEDCVVVYLTVSTVSPSRLQCKSLFSGVFAQGYKIKLDLNGNLASQFRNIFYWVQIWGGSSGGCREEEKTKTISML